MAPRPRAMARSLVLLVSAALAVGGLGAVAAPAGALARASASHPYSNPTRWPMRVATTMDCYRGNPGCTSPHGNWMMDVVPVGQSGRGARTSHAGVYAMGAGILHVGNARGPRCGKDNSYGTWVYIDHGAGVLSRYGHLSRIVGREGQYVPAGAQIGVVGTTGKRTNCHRAYVNFSVQRNGLKTTNGYDFGPLLACSARTGRTEVWPRAFSGKSSWNKVRQGAPIPASTSSCISSATPATPARPAKPRVKAGKGKLSITWKRPAAGYRANAVMVEVGEFHPSRGGYWDLPRNQEWFKLSPTKTSLTVRRLVKGHKFRVRISYRNAAGWSKSTAYVVKRTKR